MVQRLLAFSKKVEPTLRPLNLNHRIKHLRGLLERVIPKMIQIELLFAMDLGMIKADLTQIEQVLMNLVLNARDAMPDGGTLTIETRNIVPGERNCATLETAGGCVLLSVSDTGQGIAEENYEHVFEPFFTSKETGKGTGLGLATVYGIVKQHNGYIDCNNQPGIGTTFNIYFPVADVEADEQQTAERTVASAGGNETILLVDDEELLRGLAQEFLSEAGYTVITAQDGQKALEAYQEMGDKIDLVILDLIMPQMGGAECLEELRKINPQVKALVASGHVPGEQIQQLMQSGALGFVKKPYGLAEILGLIRDALDSN